MALAYPGGSGQKVEPALDRMPFHHAVHSYVNPHSFTPGQFRHSNSPNTDISGMWEKTRISRENPCIHEENMKRHTMAPVENRFFCFSSENIRHGSRVSFSLGWSSFRYLHGLLSYLIKSTQIHYVIMEAFLFILYNIIIF